MLIISPFVQTSCCLANNDTLKKLCTTYGQMHVYCCHKSIYRAYNAIELRIIYIFIAFIYFLSLIHISAILYLSPFP